jgi:hypothetical protein
MAARMAAQWAGETPALHRLDGRCAKAALYTYSEKALNFFCVLRDRCFFSDRLFR